MCSGGRSVAQWEDRGKTMKLVYVAGPYRGQHAWEVEGNIRKAEELGFQIASLGCVPVIPHTMYRFFDGTQTDKFWLGGTLELLRRCDAIIMGYMWRRSKGSSIEFDEAAKLGKPIFYNHPDSIKLLRDWLEK